MSQINTQINTRHNSQFNPVFFALPTTVFTVMSALAQQYRAINLGQGFPDEDGPLSIRRAAAQALQDGPNQYPPMRGLPELRRAIAAHAKQFYGFDFDSDQNVVVTSGGTEALTAAIFGLVGQGDEVVLIEPAYDSYRPIAEAAGATIRTIQLQPPHWRLTEQALTDALTSKTRLLIINSPLNPIGRVFDRTELDLIARCVRDTQTMVLCDEVYEHLTFDQHQHIPLLSLPDMQDRVLRVGSAGKMFSLTGWKVGWVTGSAPLIEVVAKAHQFLTFTTCPALQLGVAHGLEQEMDFTLNLARSLQNNRDLLSNGLRQIGFDILPSQGTYFLTADYSRFSSQRDDQFCKDMVIEAGVAAIPLSAFYARETTSALNAEGTSPALIRFAFCKKPDVLRAALQRLRQTYGAR